jgi:hypothetical protein
MKVIGEISARAPPLGHAVDSREPFVTGTRA